MRVSLQGLPQHPTCAERSSAHSHSCDPALGFALSIRYEQRRTLTSKLLRSTLQLTLPSGLCASRNYLRAERDTPVRVCLLGLLRAFSILPAALRHQEGFSVLVVPYLGGSLSLAHVTQHPSGTKWVQEDCPLQDIAFGVPKSLHPTSGWAWHMFPEDLIIARAGTIICMERGWSLNYPGVGGLLHPAPSDTGMGLLLLFPLACAAEPCSGCL